MAIFLFLIVSLCIQCYEVDGGRIHHQNKQQLQLHDYQNFQPSIDDSFDCVDMYDQPAFQHPLLKNHKIQLFPTFFLRTTMQNRSSSLGKAIKYQNFIGECLPGKVPILKTTMRQNIVTKSSSKSQLDRFNEYSQSYPGHHFATLETTQNMMFRGGSARIGTYNLSLQENQYSLSGIWIQSGPPTELNSIQVGTGVHPSLYGDHQIRITAYWTADGYHKTGCYNYQCPGFVQVHRGTGFGAVLLYSSKIGIEHKFSWSVKVKQDKSTGNWWCIGGKYNVALGYWPKEIFTHLSQGSSLIKYGGETFAPPNVISPPMGSGRLPKELFKNSGFISNLEIVDSNYNEVEVKPKDMKSNCDTSPNCYDVLYHGYEGSFYRQAFLFGGPGGKCGI